MARNISLLKNKRLWILQIAGASLLLLVVFAVIFFFREQTRFSSDNSFSENKQDTVPPLVAFSGDSPDSRSWHNSTFVVHPHEIDFGGSRDTGAGSLEDLRACKYIVNAGERLRKCNTMLSIIVGSDPASECSVQGTNDPWEGVQYTCALSAYAIDYAGNETSLPSRPSRLYGIDWTPPSVSKVYVQEEPHEESPKVSIGEVLEYVALVNENESKVLGCDFFVKRDDESQYINRGTMNLTIPCQRECRASLLYQFDVSGEYNFRVICQDAAGNYGFGEVQKLSLDINDPPQIRLCRVSPAQGDAGTPFSLEVIAQDPDSDTLLYVWEFGDGDVSSQAAPTHRYVEGGTYTPRVKVFDGKGGEATCSTAWVVVE